MKKNIFAMLMLITSAALLVSCSEDEGQAPGSDSNPKAAVYAYEPEKPYNADNDIRIRVAVNDKTREAYYSYEKTADFKNRLSEVGEAGYAAYVVENGTKLTEIGEGQTVQDVVITELYGAYTIVVATVNGDNRKISTVEFRGLEWEDVVTGTYQFGKLGNSWEPVSTTLQVCTTDRTLYRFKDVFGAGYSMKIVLLPDNTGADDDGPYTFFRVPSQETGRTWGDYGEVSVRDVGYWQGNDMFVTDYGYESGMYEDHSCFITVQYFVAAGSLGYGYDYFIPNE